MTPQPASAARFPTARGQRPDPSGQLDALDRAIDSVHDAAARLENATQRIVEPDNACDPQPPTSGRPSLRELIARTELVAARLNRLASRIDL